jgi:lysophospholipase L1-like esterase
VVNLAWPGAISNDIAACFDDALGALPLKVVLVSLGHNDYCYSNNYAVRRELPEGRSAFELADRISPRAETGLVLWRVLSWNLLRSSPAGDRWHRVRDRTGRFRVYYQDDEELAVPAVPGSEMAAVTSNLAANVTRMARASRERGVRLVLVGYLHSFANGVLRDLARELDLPYVDNAVSDARELMTLVRDKDETGRVDRFHPNARGQARMRDNVLRKLEEIGLVARR